MGRKCQKKNIRLVSNPHHKKTDISPGTIQFNEHHWMIIVV